MSALQQNPDGSWSEAKPVPYTRMLRVELWLRRRGFKSLADKLARWDERGLGR
jgi:hypothetical protein